MLKVIELHDPDIILLQEMPRPNFGKRFVAFDTVIPVETHSGYTSLFVKKPKFKIISSKSLSGLVLAKVDAGEFCFYLASAHLLPYKEYEKQRMLQLAQAILSITQDEEDPPLIIAGDMNMRESETKKVLELGLKDAFIEIGSPKDHKFSWNSKENKHLREAFEFTARFDRIFIKGFDVSKFELTGNTPISENQSHFISDHYAIISNLQLEEQSKNPSLDDFF